MIMKRNLLAVLFCTLLFAGFYHPLSHALIREEAPTQLVNVEGRYAMEVPDYMSSSDELNDEASLQYQNIYKEMYVIVIDESKQDFKDVFLELGEYDTTKTMLENYVDAQMKSIRENMNKITADKPERILKTGCGDARVHDVSGTEEDIDGEMGFTVGFVEGRLNLYMIMSWTFEKDKATYQADMDNMIRSFQELSGEIDVEVDPNAPKIAVDVPDDMYAGYSIEGAKLQYLSNKRDLRLAVFEKDMDYWDTKFQKRYNKEQSFLDFFTASTQTDYKNRFFALSNMSTITKGRSNEMDTQTFTFTGREFDGDRECFYKIVCVQGKNNLYIIQSWTPKADKAKDEPMMDKMIQSFREL